MTEAQKEAWNAKRTYIKAAVVNGIPGFYALLSEVGECIGYAETMPQLWTMIVANDLVRPETVH